MDISTAVGEMLEAGRRLYQKGFVASNDGNLSARLEDGTFLITPTGICKGDMAEADLLVIDAQGAVVRGTKKVTSEVKMHLAVYESRPDIDAVVHAHPQKATAFAVAHIPLDKITLPEMVFALGKVGMTDYATPSTEGLPRAVQKQIVDSNALLLKNHGALTVGNSVMEAYFAMETLEHFASISYYASQLGGAKALGERQIAELFRVRSEVYGKPKL